uniref:AlNc14C1G42 protein n=1 Tax=Albugo laibachii Nc14 TaxID=890382 RepID=F0VYP0_9STRA|nr:AlNc14C1G42 [Albugo laibachii Nc14]|eukprot:CCA13904.1 AlNc14C1G42 [Albugo laibachii Nc14]
MPLLLRQEAPSPSIDELSRCVANHVDLLSASAGSPVGFGSRHDITHPEDPNEPNGVDGRSTMVRNFERTLSRRLEIERDTEKTTISSPSLSRMFPRPKLACQPAGAAISDSQIATIDRELEKLRMSMRTRVQTRLSTITSRLFHRHKKRLRAI